MELELGSNETVNRVVAAGLGLGCLSRLFVEGGHRLRLAGGTGHHVAALHRTLSIVLHKKLGAAAEGFLRHCTTV